MPYCGAIVEVGAVLLHCLLLALTWQERSEWVLGLSHTILLIIDSLLRQPQRPATSRP